MRSLARAQAHLRCFAFRDSHKSESGKQEIRKTQQDRCNSRFQFQFVECTPIRRPFFKNRIIVRFFDCLRRRTHTAALAIAMRISRQIKQDVFAEKRREIDCFGPVQFGVQCKRRHFDFVHKLFQTGDATHFDRLLQNPVRPERPGRNPNVQVITQRPAQRIPSAASSGIGQSSSPSKCNPSAGICLR